MIEGLELRTGYLDDKISRHALADLLREIFDIDISVLDDVGGQDPTAMPFGYFDERGRCVANITTFSMPVIIHGRHVRAAGYQSGAVRPEFRGRGLYQKLMRLALAWSQAEGFEFDMLMTDKPGLYEPYGFETVPQYFFRGSVQPSRLAPKVRHLSINSVRDSDLVRALLDDRQPVSDRLAVQNHGEMFLFNAIMGPTVRLTHLPLEDVVIAWRREKDTLRILDIVGHVLPMLDKVVAALGHDGRSVELFFAPDRIGWKGAPTVYEGPCALMVRGHFPIHIDNVPLMLSPMADF